MHGIRQNGKWNADFYSKTVKSVESFSDFVEQKKNNKNKGDGNNISLWGGLLDGTGHALCHNAIRQAAERLGTDDVFNAMFNQHCHFSGDHPAFAHANAMNGIFVSCFPQIFKIMHWRKYAMLLHTANGFHLLAV